MHVIDDILYTNMQSWLPRFIIISHHNYIWDPNVSVTVTACALTPVCARLSTDIMPTIKVPSVLYDIEYFCADRTNYLKLTAGYLAFLEFIWVLLLEFHGNIRVACTMCCALKLAIHVPHSGPCNTIIWDPRAT